MPSVDENRDGPREECGVFAIYAPGHDVARLAYFALFALQHRGQESAGIAAAPRGGSIMAIRDQGLVSQVFDEYKLGSLVGEMAIGHVRYSTTGSSAWEIMAALLATHPAEALEDAVADTARRLRGAFSAVVLTEEAVVAFRDPHGLRPLALGEIVGEDGRPVYCVASESCAFDLIGARYLREVLPGEIVTLLDGGIRSRMFSAGER